MIYLVGVIGRVGPGFFWGALVLRHEAVPAVRWLLRSLSVTHSYAFTIMTNNLLVNLMRHMSIWLDENPPIYCTTHITFWVSLQLTTIDSPEEMYRIV